MLLINPAGRAYGGTLSRYAPLSVPMTIGGLAAVMMEKGHAVRIYDEELGKISEDTIGEVVEGLSQPYVFGITVFTAQVGRAYKLAGFLKDKYPDAIVILGGYYPTALPEEALGFDSVDFVVRGEGEITLPELYSAIRSKADDFSGIKGISFRRNGNIFHTPNRPLIEDINTLPDFPYLMFKDLIKNANLKRTYDWGFILTSRGCPFKCAYCSQRLITGASYRFKSTQRVLKEIEMLINEFKVTQLYFIDDNLTVNKDRIIQLLLGMRQKGYWKYCSFSFQTRADMFYPEIVPFLRRAGFTSVGFGMEVGTDRLGRVINKGQTVGEYCSAIKLAKDSGMDVHLFMLFGIPTETSEDRKIAHEITRSLNPAMLKFNNLMPYPGTPIYDRVVVSERLNVMGYWENFTSTLSELAVPFTKRHPLPYVPEASSEWELIRDIVRYNFFIMLRPKALFGFFKGGYGVGMFNPSKNWWRNLKEYFFLIKTGIFLLLNFLVALLPLRLTEPVVNILRPDFQRRVLKRKVPPS